MTLLVGKDRDDARRVIITSHYTRSVPSGKSHYFCFHNVLVVFSIPANKNIGSFLLWDGAVVWELSRLWAPDGHAPNALTQAISRSVREFCRVEPAVDAIVSYADPNAGHHGGVYRAASWIFHGQSEEARLYRGPDGTLVARRSFHSGRRGMRKAEIEELGYTEVKAPGKLRYCRPISKRAMRMFRERRTTVAGMIPEATYTGKTGDRT